MWRWQWQPTPVFLPGESQGRGSLVGCGLWGRTESDTTEATWQQQQQHMQKTKMLPSENSNRLYNKVPIYDTVMNKLITWLTCPSSSESENSSVMSNSLRPHWLYSPWNSSGQNTGVGSLSLLQGNFPTQESNRGLLHCRRILYQLSYQGRDHQFTTKCYQCH